MSPIDTSPFTPPSSGNGGGGGNGNGGDDTETDPLSVHIGDAAGGDLVGTYPNPTINPDLIFPGSPVSQADIDASTAGEAALRAAADTTEATTRAAAVTSEASTRAAADTALSSSLTSTNSTVTALTTSVSSETTARAAGDAAVTASSVQRGAEQISVLDHGLSNNGTTDNLAAWNVIVAAINAGTYDNIFFPDGIYQFSGNPNRIIASGVKIAGAGMQATMLRMRTTTSGGGTNTGGMFFQVGDVANSTNGSDGLPLRTNAVTIRDMQLTFQNTPGFAQSAFWFENATYCHVENIEIEQCACAFRFGVELNDQGGIGSSSAGADTMTTNVAHGLSVNDPITIKSSTIGGITNGNTYYCIAGTTGSTLKVSASLGGSVVDITGASGTGTWFLNDPHQVQECRIQHIRGTYQDLSQQGVLRFRRASSIYLEDVNLRCSPTQPSSGNNTVGIFMDPQVTPTGIENVHMHNVALWGRDGSGGAPFNMILDATNGDILNCFFEEMEPDQASTANVFLRSTGGPPVGYGGISNVHFNDCYFGVAEGSNGDTVHIINDGTGPFDAITFRGGRYGYGMGATGYCFWFNGALPGAGSIENIRIDGVDMHDINPAAHKTSAVHAEVGGFKITNCDIRGHKGLGNNTSYIVEVTNDIDDYMVVNNDNSELITGAVLHSAAYASGSQARRIHGNAKEVKYVNVTAASTTKVPAEPIDFINLTGGTTVNTLSNGYAGRRLAIRANANTTLAAGAGNWKTGGALNMTAGDCILIEHNGSAWYQLQMT